MFLPSGPPPSLPGTAARDPKWPRSLLLVLSSSLFPSLKPERSFKDRNPVPHPLLSRLLTTVQRRPFLSRMETTTLTRAFEATRSGCRRPLPPQLPASHRSARPSPPSGPLTTGPLHVLSFLPTRSSVTSQLECHFRGVFSRVLLYFRFFCSADFRRMLVPSLPSELLSPEYSLV